jgi:hypothetical protein
VKYPYDDNEENRNNPELHVAKSFSLQRKMIAAIRVRAKALGVSMSTYVATVIRNDLEGGTESPLSILSVPNTDPHKSTQPPQSQSRRGVVVPGFDRLCD